MKPTESALRCTRLCVGRSVAQRQVSIGRAKRRNRPTQLGRAFSSQDEPVQPKGFEELLPGATPGDSVQRHMTKISVFKKSAAMKMDILPPTWTTLPSGRARVLKRSGSVYLEFAQSNGERGYDWEKKQSFAMSPLEAASVLEEPMTNHEMIHDPRMGSINAGSIVKIFQIQMAERGLFFKLRVKEGGQEWNVSVPVSKAEYRLMRVIMEYALPHLTGFAHMVGNTAFPENNSNG